MSRLSSATSRACGVGRRSLVTAPLVAVVACSIVFWILFLRLGTAVRDGEMLATDRSVLRWIDHHTATVPITSAEGASLSGGPIAVGGTGLVLTLAFLLHRRVLDALFVTTSVGGCVPLSFYSKHLFFRMPDGGFPSGHTLGATCLVVMAGFFLWRGHRGLGTKIVGTGALITAVALIGGSRLVLGVHYPTDVLGGVLLGCAWMSALVAIRCAVTGGPGSGPRG